MQKEPHVVIHHSLCGSPQPTETEIGQRAISTMDMGLNLDRGTTCTIREEAPTEAAKTQQSVLADYFGNEELVWTLDGRGVAGFEPSPIEL